MKTGNNAIRSIDAAESERRIKHAILEGLESDEITLFNGVKLLSIWNYLRNPMEPVDKQTIVRSKYFIIENGFLKHVPRDADQGNQIVVPIADSDQLLVNNVTPVKIRNALLHLAHQHFNTAHVSADSMYAQLSEKWYWPGMQYDAKMFAASCTVCIHAKARDRQFVGELSSTTIHEDELNKCFLVDYLELKPKIFVLAIIDFYSRYLHLIPCNSIDAKTYAKAIFEEIILKHGIPKRIHSDQGTTFRASMIQHLAADFGIDLTTGTTYSPRVQGLVERAIGGVKQTIRCCLEEHPSWEVAHLMKIAASIHNHHPHRATKLSPYQVSFGATPVYLSQIPLPSEMTKSQSETADQMRDDYRTVAEIMRRKYTELFIEDYSKKSSKSSFEKGDTVYRKLPDAVGKRGAITGPHKIVRQDGKNTWILQLSKGEESNHSLWTRVPETQMVKAPDAIHLREGLRPP